MTGTSVRKRHIMFSIGECHRDTKKGSLQLKARVIEQPAFVTEHKCQPNMPSLSMRVPEYNTEKNQ